MVCHTIGISWNMSCWTEASNLLFVMNVSLSWQDTELHECLTILWAAAAVDITCSFLHWTRLSSHPCGCILLAVQYARMFSLKKGPVECRIATNMALTFKLVAWEGPRVHTDIIVWTGIDFFNFFFILMPFHPILYFPLLFKMHWVLA